MRFIFLIILIAFSTLANAVCYPTAPYSANVVIQGGTFSAGEDMAIGSIIRMQRINGYRNNIIPCSGGPAFTYIPTGGALYPGQTIVFQTGISGLGVRFKNTATGIYYGSGNRAGFSGTVLSPRFSVDVEFVKMGPITAGQVDTSFFPKLSQLANDASGGTEVAAYNFTGGSFSVQTPTCTTSDHSYDLGIYVVSSLTDSTPASSWVDTPIILTNCPVFYGNDSKGSFSNYIITDLAGGGRATQGGTIASNMLSLTLTANTAIVDEANGIVSLNDSSTATGIGVQLGNKQSGSYIVQNLSNSIDVLTTPGRTATTVSFPLAARMIKTNTAPVRAGSVNTSLIYTVFYK